MMQPVLRSPRLLCCQPRFIQQCHRSPPPARAPFTDVNTGFPTEPRNSRSIGCSESCFRQTRGFLAATLSGVECLHSPDAKRRTASDPRKPNIEGRLTRPICSGEQLSPLHRPPTSSTDGRRCSWPKAPRTSEHPRMHPSLLSIGWTKARGSLPPPSPRSPLAVDLSNRIPSS